MVVQEAKHVDYDALDKIMIEQELEYHWQVIDFLVDYYKKEERLKKEVTMTLGRVDYD